MSMRPIKTAPKNGKVVLLWVAMSRGRSGYFQLGYYEHWDCYWYEPVEGRPDKIQTRHGGGWVAADRKDKFRLDATHWMPLPKTPEARP